MKDISQGEIWLHFINDSPYGGSFSRQLTDFLAGLYHV